VSFTGEITFVLAGRVDESEHLQGQSLASIFNISLAHFDPRTPFTWLSSAWVTRVLNPTNSTLLIVLFEIAQLAFTFGVVEPCNVRATPGELLPAFPRLPRERVFELKLSFRSADDGGHRA
jgi:hypothetical protein